MNALFSMIKSLAPFRGAILGNSLFQGLRSTRSPQAVHLSPLQGSNDSTADGAGRIAQQKPALIYTKEAVFRGYAKKADGTGRIAQQ